MPIISTKLRVFGPKVTFYNTNQQFASNFIILLDQEHVICGIRQPRVASKKYSNGL